MTLYERLGGETAVQAAVVSFYERMMSDPTLAPFFDGLDMDAQIRKQVAFMTMAFGGPHKYTGSGLEASHRPLVKAGLNGQHFDAMTAHLAGALEEIGIAKDAVDEVLTFVAGTRSAVLGSRS